LLHPSIPIIIVGFRNSSDICQCLDALAKLQRKPIFSIYICENGGTKAYEGLVAALSGPSGPCPGLPEPLSFSGDAFVRGCRLRLANSIDVSIGEASGNLGYAGGINAWITPLQRQMGWPGIWVLNPDTAPAPDALAVLVDYAHKFDKGMVGSRIMMGDDADRVGSRGLAWNTWQARTIGVDKYAPAAVRPDRLDVENRIDSPHGASFYITRPCLEKIGLLYEGYFLYFEDLEWGMRAKAACGLGYAYDSVVPHIGGTTIGSGSSRRDRSELAVYLDYRNRLIFAHRNYPAWRAWTVAMVLARSVEFLAVGAFGNFKAALAGWSAGLRGEIGRPERLMERLFGGFDAL
jgi:N-acetylglucosaminyl-diphospho-decaprenol L-rhamnosyltransferase